MKINLMDLRYNENNGGEIWFMHDGTTYKISRNSKNLPTNMQGYLVLRDMGVEINLEDCEIVE